MRRGSTCQGDIIIRYKEKTLLPLDYPEGGRIRLSHLGPSQMKRRRPWGDMDLLGSNTGEDTSEQDDSCSQKSSWSLVSLGDVASLEASLGPVETLRTACILTMVV